MREKPIYMDLPGYVRPDGTVAPFPATTPNPNEVKTTVVRPETPSTEKLVGIIGQVSLLPGYTAPPEQPRLDTPLENWPYQDLAA